MTTLKTLRKSMKFKRADNRVKLLMMLEFASLDELVKLGHVYDVKRAAATLGLDPRHVRHLCRGTGDRQLGHIRIGRQYYFLPSQVLADIKVVETRA